MSSVYSQTEDLGKPQNFDNFSAASSGILQTGPRNSVENCGCGP